MFSRKRIELKTPDQVRHMRRAGLVVSDIHAALRETVRPGVTTGELDAVCAGVIEAAGARSNFLGYYDYPATVCVSVNDEVVHGIPGPRVLRAGDLVTFDCGACITDDDGVQWHGDAASGFLLDGYPRTAAQVDALDDMLSERGEALDVVVEITADADAVVERLLGRAAEQGRADDTEPVIRRRLEVYAEATAPLAAIYEDQGLLLRVDGMGGIDEVTDRIMAALAARLSV